MVNGNNIAGQGWYKELVIIPFPANDSLYYLFTGPETGIHGFYYSIINMQQDSGRGAVVQKNVQLLPSTFLTNDGLAAIKHGNGRDWWIILKDWSTINNTFYYYLVTPGSVIAHHTQNIGDIVQSGFFRIEPSLDGSRVACITNKGLIEIYSFDRCNGLLLNESLIEHEVTNLSLIPWYWGCEFSPNNSFLYVSSNYTDNDSNSYLVQYNISDPDPSASRDTLYAIKQPIVGGLVELAPDNKIYWSCAYDVPYVFYHDNDTNQYNMNLSVVNYPDSLGAACDLQPFSFYLGGKRTYYGLPNNPNYDLGPDSGSVCDTLTVGVMYPALSTLHSALSVFYHNDWKIAFINAEHLKGSKAELVLYDLSGKAIYKATGNIYNGYFTFDLIMSDYPDGLYIVALQNNHQRLTGKVVKW